MVKETRKPESCSLTRVEDIKHNQTFQYENVYQSRNRLEAVKGSYHKWCASRLHKHHIRGVVNTQQQQCDECCLARYVPSSLLKKIVKAGITSREQLMVDDQPLCLKEFKSVFPKCRMGPRSHELLLIMISAMRNCQCSSKIKTVDVTEPLLYKGKVQIESRKHLQSLFDQERIVRVDACELWWLQKQANNSGADFGFLKYCRSKAGMVPSIGP